uniref:Uncharacterized protein n=1 Tax=Amphiprion ocellaris TaxID=80972 RepID=A0AAQ5ZPY3_AMPOC
QMFWDFPPSHLTPQTHPFTGISDVIKIMVPEGTVIEHSATSWRLRGMQLKTKRNLWRNNFAVREK